MVQRIIGYMQRMPLDEIVAQPDIQALFQPLYERHQRSIDMIRERARREIGGVITFDLTGYDLEGYNKFIPVLPLSEQHLHGRGAARPASGPRSRWDRIRGRPRARHNPGDHLRALRRRRPRPRRRHQPGAQADEARRVAHEIVEELRT